MNDVLVSIITPNFNCAEYIPDTIKSVQNQTYINWELIIVDDCSTDSSIEVIESFCSEDRRIKLIKLKSNGGAAVSRNKGIELAKGNLIAFLDSDDIWLSNKLEVQVNFMIKNNSELSFSSYYLNSFEGKIIKAKKEINYNDLLTKNYIGCLTAMYSVNKIGKVYFPFIRKRQDWALWLKICRMGITAKGIEEPLAIYNNKRSTSISNNKISLLKYNWSVYRKFEKLSYIKSSYYLIILIIKKFLK